MQLKSLFEFVELGPELLAQNLSLLKQFRQIVLKYFEFDRSILSIVVYIVLK